MAYAYTRGSIWMGPEILFPLGTSLGHVKLEYLVDRETSFYGWGNNGDDQVNASYDREMQSLKAECLLNPLEGTILSAGVGLRHSSVYGRETDTLWETSPSSGYQSLWSAGPFLELTWMFPSLVEGYASVDLEHQIGRDFSYSGAGGDVVVFVPLGPATLSALHLGTRKHFGVSDTPFPYLPTLGGNTGLRGYRDRRFGGAWTYLANVELRQRIFTLALDEDNSIGFGLVLFGDAGQVADELDGIAWDRFHLDGGIGARIIIPGGGTLRADFAFSPEGLGIQMALGELF